MMKDAVERYSDGDFVRIVGAYHPQVENDDIDRPGCSSRTVPAYSGGDGPTALPKGKCIRRTCNEEKKAELCSGYCGLFQPFFLCFAQVRSKLGFQPFTGPESMDQRHV